MIHNIEWNVKQIKWIFAMINFKSSSFIELCPFCELSIDSNVAQVESIFITIKLILEIHTILKQTAYHNFTLMHMPNTPVVDHIVPMQLCSANGTMM